MFFKITCDSCIEYFDNLSFGSHATTYSGSITHNGELPVSAGSRCQMQRLFVHSLDHKKTIDTVVKGTYFEIKRASSEHENGRN
jgi:hypothetical protein